MKLTRLVVGILTVVFLTAVSSHAADKDHYPRKDLLIEPAELAKPEVAKQYVILDARGVAKYKSGHVPNAVWVDHGQWSKAFEHGKDAEGWGKRIGALGIGPETKVVVYDDVFSKDASRIWWVLQYWGVKDVRLLHGGWVGWQAGKHPTEVSGAAPSAVQFAAKARAERLASKEQVLESLKSGMLQIVDARTAGEFCGTEKLANSRAGAIPGAKHLEWIDLLEKETQRFKSAPELRKLFEQAGIVLDTPTATHCQSGGRAAVMAFGMELMGAKEVSNYYRSWSEWGNAEDTPVVPGKPKNSK